MNRLLFLSITCCLFQSCATVSLDAKNLPLMKPLTFSPPPAIPKATPQILSSPNSCAIFATAALETEMGIIKSELSPEIISKIEKDIQYTPQGGTPDIALEEYLHTLFSNIVRVSLDENNCNQFNWIADKMKTNCHVLLLIHANDQKNYAYLNHTEYVEGVDDCALKTNQFGSLATVTMHNRFKQDNLPQYDNVDVNVEVLAMCNDGGSSHDTAILPQQAEPEQVIPVPTSIDETPPETNVE